MPEIAEFSSRVEPQGLPLLTADDANTPCRCVNGFRPAIVRPQWKRGRGTRGKQPVIPGIANRLPALGVYSDDSLLARIGSGVFRCRSACTADRLRFSEAVGIGSNTCSSTFQDVCKHDGFCVFCLSESH